MEDLSKYKVHNCRYCDHELPDPFLELGVQPLANNLVRPDSNDPEFKCDLSLVLCPNCKHTQLSHVVPADLMFKHYLYVSSTTQTFRDHFAAYAKDLRSKSKLDDGGVAVDIGSNDGLQLFSVLFPPGHGRFTIGGYFNPTTQLLVMR